MVYLQEIVDHFALLITGTKQDENGCQRNTFYNSGSIPTNPDHSVTKPDPHSWILITKVNHKSGSF